MDLSASRSPQPLVLLATAAIWGQIVQLASALLLPFFSEFSLLGDNVSELALGRYGWFQTVAFLIGGATTLGLAYVIRQLTTGTWGSRVGSLLVGAYGVGAILVAIVPTDRIDGPADLASLSTTGLIHSGVALVSFVCMTVAMVVLTRTLLLESRWRVSLSRWIVLFPCAAFSLLLAQSEGPWVGLLQRLLVGVIAAWMIVVASKGRAIAGSGELSTSS